MNKRVLICANPDLNYIDGSSIWSQTVALAIAATGKATVDFMAKSTPERDDLFLPLKKNRNIKIIDGTFPNYWKGKSFRRLSLPKMAELCVRLDTIKSYDVIVIRGLEIALNLLEHPHILDKCWLYLTDIPQALTGYDSEQRQIMSQLALGCEKLLCQTEGFITLWKILVPELEDSKIKLYSPVIPDISKNLLPITARPVKAIYAGKFKRDWMTLEMAESWSKVNDRVSNSKLIMVGDKIHNEKDSVNYQKRMQNLLENTKDLQWLGAQPREAVQEELQHARVGLSWRAESMNDSLEYSTKILEYGGAGCAVILNRNSLHEQLLGHNYPLFANSTEEFVEKLTYALTQSQVTEQAAEVLMRLAKKHTFSNRVNELCQWLDEGAKVKKLSRKIRILVAGHDLKFFTLLKKKLENTNRFEFLVDEWLGHNKHDEIKSLKLLEKADVIFCEWCLGNLKWYSHNKLPHQRLVARFHLQERELPYVAESNWDSIDHISYVSEFIRREGQKTFNFPFEKTSVIPNLLDEEKFTSKRKTNEANYTLGIIGVTPARKRLDRAIDLLEALLEEDDRYCLRIKGNHPLSYSWLLKRKEELEYYENVFKRINSNPKLRYKVIFDPAGDDVNEWFTMVGFILSPSDFESFHMAIGEGMLTGSIPIVWNWDGASEIWGENYIVNSVKEAKDLVYESNMKSESVIKDVNYKHPSSNMTTKWINVING